MIVRILLVAAAVALTIAGLAPLRLEAQTPEATQTRTAEETEIASLHATIESLQTVVATLTMPTPTATPMPTATIVPPRPAGSPEPLGETWEVTVGTVSFAATWENEVADGTFARVELVITNLSDSRERFSFDQFVLRDANGRAFVPDRTVGNDLTAGWINRFDPNLPTEAFVIFDIATDATGPFVLEYVDDPTFRVTVQEEIRG
jgi:hypothetical protein